MPANLTPQYLKAELAYRQAQSPAERVAALEALLQRIPKHKGTDRLQGDLRAKLKEAKQDLLAERTTPRSGRTLKLPRQGAGTVIVVGPPNSGKSRLVRELTNAQPEVAEWPFTTREPMMAMMDCNDLQVQLVDTPPLGAFPPDPVVISALRAADAAVLCINATAANGLEQARDVLQVLQQRKVMLADRTGFAKDDLSIVRVRTLLCVTCGGALSSHEVLRPLRSIAEFINGVVVELDQPQDVESLRLGIGVLLDVIRIFTKRPSEPPDLKSPLILSPGDSVADLAKKIHDELAVSVRQARVWPSGETTSHLVGRDHLLTDGDIVELLLPRRA